MSRIAGAALVIASITGVRVATADDAPASASASASAPASASDSVSASAPAPAPLPAVIADPPPPPPAAPKQLGVDATLIAPLSPWQSAVGPGGGGSVWLHVPISPLVDVTARLGAIVHGARMVPDVPQATARLSEIPLLGGARIRVTDGVVRGYLEGEVGLIFARVDAASDGVTANSTDINFGASLGAAIEVGRFDVRASAWFADLQDLDHAIGVSISVGVHAYTF